MKYNRIKSVFLLLMIMSLLFGCSSKDEAIQRADSEESSSTVDEAVESVVESIDTHEPASELAEESPVEKKKDRLEAKFIQETTEEPEIIEGLDEYLSDIDSGTYGMSDHGTYHVCYYADDINEDGYPEVFQYRYKDRSADGREYSLLLYYMSRFWDDDKQRWKYLARMEYFGLTVNAVHVMSSDFGSDQIMLSYTKGQENIYVQWDYATLKNYISSKELKVFKDSEIFFGGIATMEKEAAENDEGFVKYFTQDTSLRYYEDEEHFNHFDSDSVYETTIIFGETELWPTYQEALDHLGEIPAAAQ